MPTLSAPGAADDSAPGAPASGAADIVFRNGAVLTMDSAGTLAQAVAIQDGRILVVGSEAEVAPFQGPTTEIIDLQGRTLMPGFVDSHTHIYEHTGRSAAGMKESQDWLLSQGITAVAEAGVREDMLDWLVEENAAGRIRVRTSLYLLFIDNCGNLLGDWYSGHPSAHARDPFLRVPGLKLFSDGGSCNVPAVSFEYAGGGNGDLYYDSQQLSQYLLDAQQQGFQAVLHALGDRGAEASLDAIETALAGAPNTYRHRIEHNTLLRDEQLARYGEIGVVPVIFGKFPTCFFSGDTSQFKYLSPLEKRAWEWRYADLIAASPGLPYAWHSDYPVFPSFDPLEHLYGFVTRKEVGPDGRVCEPADWAVDDRLPVDQALRIMTIQSAYAIFFDDVTGSLEPGKYADLVILSGNPLETAPDDLIGLSVRMTMVSGQVEYCADEGESLCPVATSSPAIASASLAASPPTLAIDGNPQTAWNSGGDAPQWIEIDLGAPRTLESVRLVVSQYPEGDTRHILSARQPGESYELLYTFAGSTQDGQPLVYELPVPLEGIQFVRIETTASPSWVAWAEIEIVTR